MDLPVELGIAFLAGLITAVSPCALPVLPIVFAGGASGSRRRPYAIIAGVVVGFTGSLLAVSWIRGNCTFRKTCCGTSRSRCCSSWRRP